MYVFKYFNLFAMINFAFATMALIYLLRLNYNTLEVFNGTAKPVLLISIIFLRNSFIFVIIIIIFVYVDGYLYSA